MGSAARVRLTTARLRVVSTPVTECGYRKMAKAEPSASVMYCHWLPAVSRLAVPGGVALKWAL